MESQKVRGVTIERVPLGLTTGNTNWQDKKRLEDRKGLEKRRWKQGQRSTKLSGIHRG